VPADAVLIYQVDTDRNEPAWLYDEKVPPADFSNNPESYWTVGEIFCDTTNNIQISVLSETADGFVLSVQRGTCDPIPHMLAQIESWPSINLLILLGLLNCH
jgi:hypothetical protein